MKIPSETIFRKSERDQLLFENADISNMRHYFWASRVLAIVDDDIRDMITAYHDTFTDEVWTGEHDYIWPGSKDSSPRYAFWRKHLEKVQILFKEEIRQLLDTRSKIEDAQKCIRSLRDDLFA